MLIPTRQGKENNTELGILLSCLISLYPCTATRLHMKHGLAAGDRQRVTEVRKLNCYFATGMYVSFTYEQLESSS